MAKIENNLRKYLTVLTCALVLSGCKNNPVSTVSGLGKVSGTIVENDKTTGKDWPLPGIKVYLINTNFKPDTVNYANNQAAFIDSAVTDSSGKYIISNIKTGNYAVAPMPVPGNYHFSLAAGSDPDSITISSRRPAYSVNFTTPYPGATGTVSGTFTMRLININFPRNESFKLIVDRREYLGFIPGHTTDDLHVEVFGNIPPLILPMDTVYYVYSYGWTSLFYTLSNQFDFEFDELGADTYTWTAFYDLTLSNCPALAVFEVDWTAHTLTRKQ